MEWWKVYFTLSPLKKRFYYGPWELDMTRTNIKSINTENGEVERLVFGETSADANAFCAFIEHPWRAENGGLEEIIWDPNSFRTTLHLLRKECSLLSRSDLDKFSFQNKDDTKLRRLETFGLAFGEKTIRSKQISFRLRKEPLLKWNCTTRGKELSLIHDSLTLYGLPLQRKM